MLRHQDSPADDDLVHAPEPGEDEADAGDEPEDREHQVARQTSPEPVREEEEEEVAEADLQEQLDDLKQAEGPDA